jgi:hypothetical protein
MKYVHIFMFIILSFSHRGLSKEEPTYLTTETPITLLSANDGETRAKDDFKPEDSVTVVHLGPDHPPKIKTLYGTVPNSIIGSPHMAIASHGRYGFVVNHPLSVLFWSQNRNNPDALYSHSSKGQLSVIDLTSSDLSVVNKFELSGFPAMAVTHPDDERIIIGSKEAFVLFRVKNNTITEMSSISSSVDVSSFDICSKGENIVAAGEDGLHLFEIAGDDIRYLHAIGVLNSDLIIQRPFSPRIGPSDKYAIVLNGGGISNKGSLDDALIIDLTLGRPKVVNAISKLADGLESLAFHPDGHMAVISCLDHYLAVIDLLSDRPRILYYIYAASIPEGIEFTPNGEKLFVGLTFLDHIAVFDVEGYRLNKSPFVIKTGYGPSSMAIGSRFQ